MRLRILNFMSYYFFFNVKKHKKANRENILKTRWYNSINDFHLINLNTSEARDDHHYHIFKV